LVEDPVDARFDADGKLYVVEMRGYMPDYDGDGENAPVGRIVILRDTNGDGKFDTKTVFLDHLVLPRAVTPVAGGALVGAPPHLWFCRDTNGDDHADEKIEVANDFGVAVDPKRPALANPERAPNHPLWDLDNWIYSAAYMTKFRYVNGEWKKALTVFRGQYGLSQDDDGRLFSDSNSDQLRVDVIPDFYLSRNPDFQHPAGINVNAAENQFVWPARVNPGINRGYRPEMLRDYKLKEFTAACSPFIFCSDLFPKEFYGNAFVAEPAGNLVHRDVLRHEHGTITSHNPYHQAEFIASTDERFRPVNFFSGPDGALYIVDFHRGNIEHRISLTTYLRKQGEQRGLEKPIHLGRIFRVTPINAKTTRSVFPGKQSPAQWVSDLANPRSWVRFTAQRLLVEKRDLSTVAALENVVKKSKVSQAKIQALWSLEGMDALQIPIVAAALKDKYPRVRAQAIRVAEDFFHTEDRPEMIDHLLPLTNDRAPEVRLQLALTLGQARQPDTDRAMLRLVEAPDANTFLPDAVLSGLQGREMKALATLLQDGWNHPSANAVKTARGLAQCVMTSRDVDGIGKLLDQIASSSSPSLRRVLLDGMIAGKQKRPVRLAAEPAAWVTLEKSGAEISARLAKLNLSVVWPGKPGVPPEPVIPPLTPEQQQRFAAGKRLFAGSCAACHQLHGMGMDGLAPSLVDSEWVLGSDQRLVRIVLKGLTGPLRVNGRGYHLDMPSMGIFDDDQLASILTYVRRAWDNGGNPVSPETVASIRKATASRQEAWSQPELLNVP
ncbi:MAG TPA: c-type cytochrome, partial [Verrucomicrobiae bacterium]|nr:c-type cytochrome [Verrucomicrobiae bacterium]